MNHGFSRPWPRRLLAAGLASLALHLLLAAGIGRYGTAPPAATPAPLAVRLRMPAAPPMPAAAPAPALPLPAATPPATRPPRASAPSPAPADAATPATAATDAPPADPGLATGAGAPLLSMPGRYRVRMPPAVHLSYTIGSERPGAGWRAGADASLAFQTDGDRYRLTVDGVPGRLSSEGATGDAGILPRQATELQGDTPLVTRFDGEAAEIAFADSGATAHLYVGSQDRASVLLQLAGIGLADPQQMRGVIEIVVAGSRHAEVVRYQVVGEEQVDTGIGRMAAWHLMELTPPGSRRLELWLAPQQQWLPVKLRATDPDGTVVTQTLKAAGVAATLTPASG